ncbi:hypothetical protein N0V88_005402 [Collariella sp. IMI 366227]|nr:hypothetical protein N0V88_005402 [Collariella sp. IMI 366227]
MHILVNGTAASANDALEPRHGTTHPRPSTRPGTEEWILVDGTPASCVQIGLYHFFRDRGPIDLVVSGPNYGRNTTAVFALSSGTLGAALEAAVCKHRAVALSYAFFNRNHDTDIIQKATRRSVRTIEALWEQWPGDGSVDLYSVNVPLLEGLEEGGITPLKANFFQTAHDLHGKELKLGPFSNPASVPEKNGAAVTQTQDLAVRQKPKPRVYALIDYADDYVQPLIMAAMEALLPPDSYTLVKPPATWSASASPDISLKDIIPDAEPGAKILQIMPYESLDFDHAATHSGTCLINSYMIRKALIRKHFLSATVDNWVAKHPASVLKTNVKRSEHFEVDYAEFLDDALVEAFDLRESMEKNASLIDAAGDDAQSVAKQLEWWILKPSMSDRGQGIRLFSTMEQLQGIFDGWEGDEDSDAEDGNNTNDGSGSDDDENDNDNIMTSHLRHFVAQPYIHPLLLPELNNRKFHIRVYVLAVGSMHVYVYNDMLALFAGKPYAAPGSAEEEDLDAHLTNTCLQTSAPQIPSRMTSPAASPPFPFRSPS